MACNPQVFSGLPANCDSNRGGVNVVYIANKADVASVALDDSSKKIKTITMQNTAKFI